MALTELQRPTKERFYNDLIRIADELYRHMASWTAGSEFIADIDAADLTTIGVPTGQVRTDLVQLRTVLSEIVSLYQGNAVTPTYNPGEVVDKIRRMLPI